MKSLIKIGLLLILILSLLVSCEDKKITEPLESACNPSDEPGELLGTQFITTITPAIIQQYLTEYGLGLALTLDYTVDLYSVSYATRDKNGALIETSGLFIIPRGLDSLDLASVQHGTAIRRADVGSINPFIAIDGLLMAMKGYFVMAPDYIGLGSSLLLHPYLHAELSANAVIDMIRSARRYACENELNLSDKLFLAGYSEGGFVTLAAQKFIETQYPDEFTITAVAPMAGPYDLIGSTRTLLGQERYESPAYLAYLVVAYNDIYGWDRLNDIFNEPFASAIPDLFDGNIGADSINQVLPTRIDSLFNADFVSGFLAGEEQTIESALIENGFGDWGPIAPVLLIHGADDEIVSPSNAVAVQNSLLENGGTNVDLVLIPGVGHVEGWLPAFIIAQSWFDAFHVTN